MAVGWGPSLEKLITRAGVGEVPQLFTCQGHWTFSVRIGKADEEKEVCGHRAGCCSAAGDPSGRSAQLYLLLCVLPHLADVLVL